MNQKENSPILITGSQRSGTSLVAGILFYLGVYMGEYFLHKDTNNPTGYFEDIEFLINDQERHTGRRTKEQWETRLKQLIEHRSKEWDLWGWKAPGAALFIEEIIDIAHPKIIWCQRNKEDTMKSIDKMFRDDTDKEGTYQDKVDNLSKLEDIFIIKFEDIIKRPQYEIGRLAGYLDLNPTEEKLQRAQNHIIKKPQGIIGEPCGNYL